MGILNEVNNPTHFTNTIAINKERESFMESKILCLFLLAEADKRHKDSLSNFFVFTLKIT